MVATTNEESEMTRTALKIVLAMALTVMCAVGCENDHTDFLTSPASNNDVVLPLNKAKVDPLDTIDPLDLTQEFLDTLEYEEFTGTIQPGVGGQLTVEMTTWVGGCLFGLQINPSSVPADWGPTTFSMRIPTYQSYVENPGLPLIVRLEPSGLNFLEPIGVMATYMPWSGLDAEDMFEYFCLLPEFAEYGEPTAVQVDRYVRLYFYVNHFSDWGVGGGAVDHRPSQEK